MAKPFIAFHYDIARGTYPTKDTFARALRLAAKCGFTHFVPYLENMIRLPSIEKACPPCAYTLDDWREFEAIAKEAGIEMIPQFNVIGHTELICPSYPELGGEVSPGRLDVDVEREATQAWTRRCLDEFCNVATSEYFWIGADEWQPPRHLLTRPGFDVGRAWVDQVNRAVEFLAARGRRPLVAHDMLLHYPETLNLLSRKSVILFWFYDHDADYPALDMFKRLGFATLMLGGVFGMGSPRLTRRSADGIRCAVAASRKHQADGILVTTWEGARWEVETFNIPAIAGLLRGEEPPAAVLDALTLLDTLPKVPADSSVADAWKTEARQLLADKAWAPYPELRRCSLAVLNGDAAEDLASYLQFHYPAGHQYESLAHPPTPAVATPAPAEPPPVAVCEPGFGLTTEVLPKAGPVLRFRNGDERFAVYPNFGATLQDWHFGPHVVIPSSIERFLERDPLPGGYRSFTAAGGFRPVWAMGVHHNPCIIWQRPYDWRVIEESPDRVAVELCAEFFHVAITLRIGIERGQSGFTYEARAGNRLAQSYGAFNFNLPLVFTPADVANMRFWWTDGSTRRGTTVRSQAQAAFWLPAPGPLTVAGTAWRLTIDAAPEQTAGYFADWSSTFITPDLHGVYRPLKVGEETVTRWRFSLAT